MFRSRFKLIRIKLEGKYFLRDAYTCTRGPMKVTNLVECYSGNKNKTIRQLVQSKTLKKGT